MILLVFKLKFIKSTLTLCGRLSGVFSGFNREDESCIVIAKLIIQDGPDLVPGPRLIYINVNRQVTTVKYVEYYVNESPKGQCKHAVK